MICYINYHYLSAFCSIRPLLRFFLLFWKSARIDCILVFFIVEIRRDLISISWDFFRLVSIFLSLSYLFLKLSSFLQTLFLNWVMLGDVIWLLSSSGEVCISNDKFFNVSFLLDFTIGPISDTLILFDSWLSKRQFV